MKTALLFASVVLLASPAFAHVRMKPNQSKPGVSESYTLRVPSEGGRTTTSVTLSIPEGVTITSVAVSAGLPAVTFAHKQTGTDTAEITWNVEIKPDDAAELSFVAQNPTAGSAIIWKVVQKYSDGSSVAWVGPKGDKAPAAVTALDATAGK